MEAISGKVFQNINVSQCYHQSRQFSNQYRRDCFAPFNSLPFDGGKVAWTAISSMQLGKVAWTAISSMQLRTFSTHQINFISRGPVHCNAAPSTISSLDNIDFQKLQNGSDIRGVSVAGVEGEPVNVTELVAEAIGAGFAAWLLEKKKADGSRRFRVSIGHDSRISAKKLQDAISQGITGAGLDVIQYGLASTPAMFNSTLTEDEALFCPADGSIMITDRFLASIQAELNHLFF